MSRKIIYIVNPISGARARKDLDKLIIQKTESRKIPFHIFPSVESGDYSFLHPIIEEEKITDVVVAGGDGTVNQVISNLMNHDLNFGVIPCGSGNGLALAARISTTPEKALDTIFNGKPRIIDSFLVNGEFACMLSGLGFDAQVAQDFVHQKKRGLGTYIRLALKNFLTMRSYQFQLVLQDLIIDTDAYFISFANSNQFGNNFTIAPRASLTDGLLDIVIVTNQNKVSFILETLRQMAGFNELQPTTLMRSRRGIIYFQVDKLVIKNLSHAPLHVDGEPREATEEVKIEVIKNCFRLIHPAPAAN